MMQPKRLPSRAREAYQLMSGMEAILDKFETDFEPIVRRVPYGWRDLRLIHRKLEKLNKAILDTLPDDQVRTIVYQLMISEMRFIVKRADTGTPTDLWVMDRGDISYLINKASETMCLMCDGSNRHNCRLRKIILDTPSDVTSIGEVTMPCMGGGMLDI